MFGVSPSFPESNADCPVRCWGVNPCCDVSVGPVGVDVWVPQHTN